MTRDQKKLVDHYHRLRNDSSVLRDGGARFEGRAWHADDAAMVRKAEGWTLRVYPIEGGVEACLIDPKGVSRTYA